MSKPSFVKVLSNHGFVKVKSYGAGITCMAHPTLNRYAEIYNDNCQRCWLIGDGLKTSPGYPGGWMYDTAQQMNEQLTNPTP